MRAHSVIGSIAICWACGTALLADQGHAVRVLSYDPGSTPHTEFGTGLPFDVAQAALGEPERMTGEGLFPGVVSPFNPPFLRSELVSIGEGGHLTLQLSHFAVTRSDSPQLGIFANVGLLDVDGDFTNPSATAGESPVSSFGSDPATLEVSADGVQWVSLGTIEPNVPANGFADQRNPFAAETGSVPSDFHRPFSGSLDDFAGLAHAAASGPDILTLLSGSGGGTWLNLASTGLDRVGYLRLSVADDLNDTTGQNFELDAVTIASAALGSVVPEPTGCSLVCLVFVAAAGRLRLGGRRTQHERHGAPSPSSASPRDSSADHAYVVT